MIAKFISYNGDNLAQEQVFFTATRETFSPSLSITLQPLPLLAFLLKPPWLSCLALYF